MRVPAEVDAYLKQIVRQLAATLGDRIAGIYLVGSLALGDYRPTHSDIDVYALVHSCLTTGEKLAIARCCGNHILACPGKRLELVVLTADKARAPSATPRWELNFNTGVGEPDHVGIDPEHEPGHWFVLDLALGSRHGVRLLGPPASQAIGSPTDAQIRAAQLQTIAWYAERAMPAEAAIAACRMWHWLERGRFASKSQALRWASARLRSELRA